jgi:hypothetical protein
VVFGTCVVAVLGAGVAGVDATFFGGVFFVFFAVVFALVGDFFATGDGTAA